MLQPMLGALLESANPFAQSHHSSYCAPGSLMKLYEAYIVWFTFFFSLFFRSFTQPSNQFQPSVHRVVDICAGYVPVKKNRPAQCRDRCDLHSGTLWHFLRDITHVYTYDNNPPLVKYQIGSYWILFASRGLHEDALSYISHLHPSLVDWRQELPDLARTSAICDLRSVHIVAPNGALNPRLLPCRAILWELHFQRSLELRFLGFKSHGWRMVTAYFAERTCSNLSMISMISMISM